MRGLPSLWNRGASASQITVTDIVIGLKRSWAIPFAYIAMIVEQGGRMDNFESEIKCPECGEVREDDDRVAAGLKCGSCAYA